MDIQAIIQAKISELRHESELETRTLYSAQNEYVQAKSRQEAQAAKVQSLGMAIASLEYELNKFLEYKGKST